jgi:hypothetical protein
MQPSSAVNTAEPPGGKLFAKVKSFSTRPPVTSIWATPKYLSFGSCFRRGPILPWATATALSCRIRVVFTSSFPPLVGPLTAVRAAGIKSAKQTIMANETKTLAEFAATLRYEDIPAPVIAITKACVIDAIAVALFWQRPAVEQKRRGFCPPRWRCRLQYDFKS